MPMQPRPIAETARPSVPRMRVPTDVVMPASWQGSLAELFLDGGEVDPRALPGDQAVLEVEDVQEARAHRPAASVETERMTRGGGVQHRLVDDVVGPVATADGLEAVDAQLREQ